jgi:citrate synthase
MILHEKISAQLPAWRERIKVLAKDHADVVVDQVTVGQIVGGMRDIKSLLTDVSFVDPAEGIRFRGMSIPEVLKALPKARGTKMPLVGGLYYLLMVGEVPTKEQALEVEAEWAKRAEIPDYVYKMLKVMPKEIHPMILLSQAVMAMAHDSEFTKKYHEGMKKDVYWESALEDSLNLTAKLPVIAAFIYRMKYFGEKSKPRYNPKLDYGANFARMMKISDKKGYAELSRLYFILHSDHESGNVSAHATHLVGSSLSDIYFAFSAGLSGLAGPLHGLANQECLAWLIDVMTYINLPGTRSTAARSSPATDMPSCASPIRASRRRWNSRKRTSPTMNSCVWRIWFSMLSPRFSKNRVRPKIPLRMWMPSAARSSITTVCANLTFTQFCSVSVAPSA